MISKLNPQRAFKSVFNINALSTNPKIFSGELKIETKSPNNLFYNLESLYGTGSSFRTGGPGTGYFSRLQRLASILPILSSSASYNGSEFIISWTAHEDITPELIYSLKDELSEKEETFVKNRTKLRMLKSEIPIVDVFAVPTVSHYSTKVQCV